MSPYPDRRLRVLLLFGGQSAEHDVSRVSAVAVARALDPDRYDVVPVAITREGRWLLADRARAALESGRVAVGLRGRRGARPPGRAPARASARRWCGSSRAATRSARSTSPSRSSTAPTARTGRSRASWSWPACPTSGSGVLGSAVGMDKVMMKRAFTACGLATPRARGPPGRRRHQGRPRPVRGRCSATPAS